MNYYPHHIGDYAKDTAHLSMLEDGAYRRMLDLLYASERPLPRDQEKLYRLVRARSHAEKLAVDVVLGEFFIEGDDGWHQRRAEEEIAKAQEKSTKAKGSAGKRWQSERNAKAYANALPTQCEGNAPNNQEPRATSQKPVARTPKGKPVTDLPATRAPRANGEAPKTADCWAAFTMAYRERYKTAPTRNAVENAAMAAFVELVPLEEAPDIAAFYVRHNKAWYVSHQHSVKFLRQDAAGLRTQWLAGRTVTDTEARQADRTAATGNAFTELLREAKAA